MSATVALTSPLFWYSSRALGTVALVLLSASVVLGILTSTRSGPASVPRFAVASLHRTVALVAMVVVCLHVLTAVADTYVPVGWTSVLVPFTSGYRPLWIGFGTIAFDLLVVVIATSLLRGHISAGSWRAVHWLVYVSFPVAVIHGIGVGTDLRFSWMDLLTGLCLAAVVAAVAWRVWANPHQGGAVTARPPASRNDPDRTGLPAGAGRRH